MEDKAPTPEELMQDPFFHIFLLKYYFMYSNAKERNKQNEDDILHFEFGENTYSIAYKDLKDKAGEEYLLWKSQKPVYKDKEFEYILRKA